MRQQCLRACLSRFLPQLPVGTPQYAYPYNAATPLKNLPVPPVSVLVSTEIGVPCLPLAELEGKARRSLRLRVKNEAAGKTPAFLRSKNVVKYMLKYVHQACKIAQGKQGNLSLKSY